MRFSTLALIACLAIFAARAPATELPAAAVPDTLGVNIHFTDPKPGEMEMLAAAGFRVIRMDFAWGGTERDKGKYDFSAYDRLLAALDQHRMRALFILDYSNRHYDEGLSPYSDEGRRAFARWASAAVERFRGRGVLWEMYNEPNIRFWKPEPNVEHYVKLATEVGKAIRQVAPGEIYIGPATSQIDMEFLEACFQGGLLEYWDAVSVHPYRQTNPETVIPEYARLRALIDRYAPADKQIPILSGEWGYSAAWKGMDEVKQGKLLPRQWLTNLACDIPVSIWYDWHDDGPDPKEAEHHFGTVLYPYHKDRRPVYEPKPAYHAAATLAKQLDGFRFNKRLDTGKSDEYVLLFSRGDEVRLAAWTTAAEPRQTAIPASPGRFRVTSHTGDSLPVAEAGNKGLTLSIADAPKYLVPDGTNDLLRIAAAWQRAPGTLALRAQRGAAIPLSLKNPLGRPIHVSTAQAPPRELAPGATVELPTRFDLPRSEEPVDVRLACSVEGMGRLVQTARVTAVNPLRLTLGPVAGKNLAVRVENPSGEPFQGTVRLTDVQGLELQQTAAKLDLAKDEKTKDVVFPLAAEPARFQLGLRIDDAEGRPVLERPPVEMSRVDDFSRYSAGDLELAYKLVPDGDAKIGSEQAIQVANAPPGLPGAASKALKITYCMEEGWKFLRLVPQSDSIKKIDGRPKAMGLWLHGDGSANSPRLRFVDATGQTHQPTADSITWTGWRYVEFPLDGAESGHWGGADDGKVHWPIRFDTLFLLDGLRRATRGEVFLASPVLIW